MSRTRRGKRSQIARLQRVVARIVSKASHRDYRKSESVNVLTEDQVFKLLAETQRDGAQVADLLPASEMFTRGEVISDSRGQGSQQQVIALG